MMADLVSLNAGALCVPLFRTFETLDSWFVMKKAFCAPSKNNLCLVGFQMTITRRHPLKQAGMVRVIKKAEELFNCTFAKDNILAFFVTTGTEANVFNVQPWLTVIESRQIESKMRG